MIPNMVRWPLCGLIRRISEKLRSDEPIDKAEREILANGADSVAMSVESLMSPLRPGERFHARLMREAIGDMMIDRLVKLRSGNYSALSRAEVSSQCAVLELMLARIGFTHACEFWKRQTNDATRVEYPGILDFADALEEK